MALPIAFHVPAASIPHQGLVIKDPLWLKLWQSQGPLKGMGGQRNVKEISTLSASASAAPNGKANLPQRLASATSAT